MKKSWLKYLLIGMALFLAVFLGNLGVMVSSAKLTASNNNPTGVQLNTNNLTLARGSGYKLTAKVYPDSAYNKSVYWSSDNKGVADVDSTGNVTAKAKGTCTITVKTWNGYIDKCKITVVVMPDGLNIGLDTLTMNRGAGYTFVPTFHPADATETKLKWESSEPDIVSVDQNGNAIAKKIGQATISATTVNGIVSKCLVTVEVYPNGIGPNVDRLEIESGKQFQLRVLVVPEDATNKSLTYTSSNQKVAVVSSTGLVTGVASGSANITIRTWNGLTRVIPVNVVILPTGITLDITSAKMYWGEEKTLTPTIYPSNATNKDVTWEISPYNKKTIGSVNGGKVKVWDTGKVTVTATTVNGFKATCTVTVLCDAIAENPYADARVGTWQYKAIDEICKKGYMTGKGTFEGRILFDPNSSINRSQFVTALYAIDGKPATDYSPEYYDVPSGQWYSIPITWASKNGIVKGNPGGKFSPDSAITREQIALILYNYAKYKHYDVSASADLSKYPDAGKVDTWAVDAMKWAVAVGIISGKGNASEGYWLDPLKSASRVECAAMLNKFTDMNSAPTTVLDEETPIALPDEMIEEDPASADDIEDVIDDEDIIDDEDEDVIDDEDEDIIDDEDEDVIDDEDEDVIDDEDGEVVDDEDGEVIDDENEDVIDEEEEAADPLDAE